MPLSWIIAFSIFGSVGAILAAIVFLLIGEKTQKILVSYLISYATGTLLAAALLGLLQNSLQHISSIQVMSALLIGIIFFFSLEKLLIWRHCHNEECERHGTAGPIILVGDAFHNFTDGIVIAASFLVSIPIGIVIGLSVITHEIPQEVGDFAILLHGGYSRRRALLLNTLSSLSTLPGAILAYYALDIVHYATPYVMAFSAASFLYIALADLVPELHDKIGFRHSVQQFLLMLAGVGTIILILYGHF
jgi:zinc and cadmium transporter